MYAVGWCLGKSLFGNDVTASVIYGTDGDGRGRTGTDGDGRVQTGTDGDGWGWTGTNGNKQTDNLNNGHHVVISNNKMFRQRITV